MSADTLPAEHRAAPEGPRGRKTYLIAGVLLGVLVLAAFRFAFVPAASPTHFHANFALFVHGERVDLSDDRYMEEVGACKASDRVLPTERAHLHGNDPDVAHIHHEGVTWGHLLANLGFGLGERYLAADDGRLLTERDGRTLNFILNGQPQFAVHNELIRSGDRLLISYGSETEQQALQTQYPAVAANAEEFNQRPDPAECSGPVEPTLWDRLVHAFAG